MKELRKWAERSEGRRPVLGIGSGLAFTLIELLVVIAIISLTHPDP